MNLETRRSAPLPSARGVVATCPTSPPAGPVPHGETCQPRRRPRGCTASASLAGDTASPQPAPAGGGDGRREAAAAAEPVSSLQIDE